VVAVWFWSQRIVACVVGESILQSSTASGTALQLAMFSAVSAKFNVYLDAAGVNHLLDRSRS
jgi:hypothetical protein